MKSILLTILISLTVLAPFTVLAQELDLPEPKGVPQIGVMSVLCDNTASVTNMMKQEYNETTAVTGILNENQSQIFQLLYNPKEKSFTILISDVNGISCFIAAGRPLIIFNHFNLFEEESVDENFSQSK